MVGVAHYRSRVVRKNAGHRRQVADRAALWDRVSNAAFLTLNEKREAVGYGPVSGGDKWG